MNMHVSTADATHASIGSNTRSYRDELLATVGDLGRAEGAGVNSRPELAAQVTAAAYAGTINADTKVADVAEIWSAYSQAMNEAKGDKTSGPQASAEQQISKLRVFAKLGETGASQNFDAVTYLGKVREMVNSTDGTKGSTFDNLVKIGRETVKLGVELTDEEIRTILVPAAKDEITDDERELAELSKMLKATEKLRDGTSEKSPRPSPEIDAMIDAMKARMGELDVAIKHAALTLAALTLAQNARATLAKH